MSIEHRIEQLEAHIASLASLMERMSNVQGMMLQTYIELLNKLGVPDNDAMRRFKIHFEGGQPATDDPRVKDFLKQIDKDRNEIQT